MRQQTQSSAAAILQGVSFEKVTVDFKLKEDFIVKLSIHAAIKKPVDGKNDKLDLDVEIDLKNINKVKSITYPSDLSEYPDRGSVEGMLGSFLNMQ